MIVLNFSNKEYSTESFDFFVERVEVSGRYLYGIVDIKSLFPNITGKDWVNKDFCLIPYDSVADNGEILLETLKIIQEITKRTGGLVRVYIDDTLTTFVF